MDGYEDEYSRGEFFGCCSLYLAAEILMAIVLAVLAAAWCR
ncbi:MAG TPA: hypothetical protein PJ994_07270 [Tepidiformaceae bacterium]|nr:hypothetical protein [Tepidiformaceae bacterium]HMO95204.1 hypothetical protein [Tepidiformaceae bacterium]